MAPANRQQSLKPVTRRSTRKAAENAKILISSNLKRNKRMVNLRRDKTVGIRPRQFGTNTAAWHIVESLVNAEQDVDSFSEAMVYSLNMNKIKTTIGSFKRYYMKEIELMTNYYDYWAKIPFRRYSVRSIINGYRRRVRQDMVDLSKEFVSLFNENLYSMLLYWQAECSLYYNYFPKSNRSITFEYGAIHLLRFIWEIPVLLRKNEISTQNREKFPVFATGLLKYIFETVPLTCPQTENVPSSSNI